MTSERQREGIALAKKAGVYRGRKPSLTAEQADDLGASPVRNELLYRSASRVPELGRGENMPQPALVPVAQYLMVIVSVPRGDSPVPPNA